MAHFRSTISGNRGEASRLGHKTSGMVARVNGWTSGVRVYARHHDGKDEFQIYATSGSDHRGGQVLLGHVDNNGQFVPVTA